MNPALHPPAYGHFLSIPATVIYAMVLFIGTVLFGYLIYNRLEPLNDSGKVYTYHDPCYLGRHYQICDDPDRFWMPLTG